MSYPAIVEAAERAGLQEIGLTDHPHRRGLARHHEALDRMRDEFPPRLKLWIGAELEVMGLGQLIIPPPELPLADYLLAAPSHYDLINFPPVNNLEDPVAWADRMMTDMENVPGSGAHGMAHPFFVFAIIVRPPAGMKLPLIEQIFAEIRPRRMSRLLERLAEGRVALEISPRLSCTPTFEGFLEGMYREAKAAGCKFYTGSDSHQLETVGKLGRSEAFAQRLALEPTDFWSPWQITR